MHDSTAIVRPPSRRTPFAVIALVAVATAVTIGAHPATAQTDRDPSWVAEVQLDCPGGDVSQRTIGSFTPQVDPGQTAALHLATFDPASNGFRLEPVDAGSVVPAAVVANNGTSTGPQLQWSIVGVQLGPWPIDALVDNCPLPQTGGATTPLLILGVGLIAAGMLAIGLGRRRFGTHAG
jgi:LPXTG-motif cell wall-anchored protein